MTTQLLDPALLADPREATEFITNILQASTEYSIIGKGLDGTILLWNEGAIEHGRGSRFTLVVPVAR